MECLNQNKVDCFGNLRVIKSKWQAPNLKEILTKAEFLQKQDGVFKFPDQRCEFGNSYTFKSVDKTFNLKTHFSCDNFNLLYIIICLTCGETYTDQTAAGKTKLTMSESIDNISGNLGKKVEEHFRMCGFDNVW